MGVLEVRFEGTAQDAFSTDSTLSITKSWVPSEGSTREGDSEDDCEEDSVQVDGPEEATDRGADGEDESRGRFDSELDRVEEELRKPVPLLLDEVVARQSSSNECQRDLDAAHSRYRAHVACTAQLRDELRSQHGQEVLDRARPAEEAAWLADRAADRTQASLREFHASAACHALATVELRDLEERVAEWSEGQTAMSRSQREGVVRATMQVVKCVEDRDERERAYRRALQSHQLALRRAEDSRQLIGEALAQAIVPRLRELRQRQESLSKEQARIADLQASVQGNKSAHRHAMQELERISESVHAARTLARTRTPRS